MNCCCLNLQTLFMDTFTLYPCCCEPRSCRVAVCGCHQCPSIPISPDSNKKQGLQSEQIVRMQKVPHRSYFTPTYFL